MKRLWKLTLAAAILLAPRIASATEGVQSGTWEIRLQTASALGGGLAGFLTLPAPGVGYNTESETFSLNLTGGTGYYLSDAFSLGTDLSFTLLAGEGGHATIFGIAPYVKYVSNMKSKGTGFFAEPSAAFSLLSAGSGDSVKIFQPGAWAGLHAFIADGTALAVGPFVAYNAILDTKGVNSATFGLRLGISTYIF